LNGLATSRAFGDKWQNVTIAAISSKRIEKIMNTIENATEDIRVMTSGAFTAAYLELIPRLELLTNKGLMSGFVSLILFPSPTNRDHLQ